MCLVMATATKAHTGSLGIGSSTDWTNWTNWVLYTERETKNNLKTRVYTISRTVYRRGAGVSVITKARRSAGALCRLAAMRRQGEIKERSALSSKPPPPSSSQALEIWSPRGAVLTDWWNARWHGLSLIRHANDCNLPSLIAVDNSRQQSTRCEFIT